MNKETTFRLSLPEIQMIACTKCSTENCPGTCSACVMVRSVTTEACMYLEESPFVTDPPPLFRYLYPFHSVGTGISVAAIIVGYLYVLKHADLVMNHEDNKAYRRRAVKLFRKNKNRASQWGTQSCISTLGLCMFFELRILYTLAVFEVVGKDLENDRVEKIFQGLLSQGLLSRSMRVIGMSNPENDTYKEMFEHVRNVMQAV